jgi:hypothetical protein
MTAVYGMNQLVHNGILGGLNIDFISQQARRNTNYKVSASVSLTLTPALLGARINGPKGHNARLYTDGN